MAPVTQLMDQAVVDRGMYRLPTSVHQDLFFLCILWIMVAYYWHWIYRHFNRLFLRGRSRVE